MVEGQRVRIKPDSALGCGLSGRCSLATVVGVFTYQGEPLVRLRLIRPKKTVDKDGRRRRALPGRDDEIAVARPYEVERVDGVLQDSKSEDEFVYEMNREKS
jgi:hypothetical protein